MKKIMDIDVLRQLLAYDSETGKLTWLPRSNGRAGWNTQFAGTLALNSLGDQGYRRGAIFDRVFLAHRVIWAMVHGEWPDQIDHINGDRSDNRLSNLRNVTGLENSRNQRVRSRISGSIGVHWHNQRQKWQARIGVGGSDIYLGLYSDFDHAVSARKDAESEYGFHTNHGRNDLE